MRAVPAQCERVGGDGQSLVRAGRGWRRRGAGVEYRRRRDIHGKKHPDCPFFTAVVGDAVQTLKQIRVSCRAAT